MDYEGRVAVVTGASSGIGRDTALELARRGTTVVAVARREHQLRELIDECRSHASDSVYLAGDLGERGFAESVVHDSARRHGRLDILINNAGIPMHKHIYEVSADDVERVMRINFMSSVWTTLAAIPHMLRLGEGWIVNVSSFAARVAPPRETPYTASKCAMDGFTEGLWNDLAGSNIQATIVTPGPIDTEIWDKDDSPSAYEGPKYPPKVVVDTILRAIERRDHEVVSPKWSVQLMSARLLRALAPRMLRRGMAWMEPVAIEVIDEARRKAEARFGPG